MRLRNEGTFPRTTIADRIRNSASSMLNIVDGVLPVFSRPVADLFVDLDLGKVS